MFVVWDMLLVKGRGGGPFLQHDPGYAPPWSGLRCEHHGTGRTEWVPFVVRLERRDGLPRQELIFRLPAIRSCCIADNFARAAWWHDVDWALKLWGELGDGSLAAELASERATLLADLRLVVSKPTPAGIRKFAAFREDRAAEDDARDQANRAYWAEQVRRHEFRGDDEHPAPDCFTILRLHPNATLLQIKARHRELAMRHHPDRGGDPARFRMIQDAYERAVAVCERRTSG